jgi:hypothetical protein
MNTQRLAFFDQCLGRCFYAFPMYGRIFPDTMLEKDAMRLTDALSAARQVMRTIFDIVSPRRIGRAVWREGQASGADPDRHDVRRDECRNSAFPRRLPGCPR